MVMNNCMLDTETLGIAPGCAIRSIGAVMFDPISGEIGGEFYRNVEDESCIGVGLTRDEATVRWWARQGEAAQAALLIDQRPLFDVLTEFALWFQRSQGIFVWAQGSNFDEPIVQAAMRACQIKPPWRYYNVRDTRTAYEIARFDPRSIKRNGTHHSALDDAKHQARCVQRAYAQLYQGRAA